MATEAARTGRAATFAPASQARRAPWRSVAVPSEHGGWSLTAEPVVLGLALVPSWSGLCFGLATVVAFLARTPLRLVLVDRRRGRRLDRTRRAARVLILELTVLVALVAAGTALAEGAWWAPVVAVAPLVAIELWFEARSRARRLTPELAGAAGITSAAAVIVLAGGGHADLAVSAWLVLAARDVSAIPAVRAQVARLHGHDPSGRPLLVADLVAVGLLAVAVALEPRTALGAVAAVAAIAVQRATAGRADPAKVIGIRQVVLGLTVVVATALGVHAP